MCRIAHAFCELKVLKLLVRAEENRTNFTRHYRSLVSGNEIVETSCASNSNGRVKDQTHGKSHIGG